MNTADRLKRLVQSLDAMGDRAKEDGRDFEAMEFARAHDWARQILAELPGNEKQSGNPWARFLEARSDVIADFVKDERTWEGIAYEVSADEHQVRLISENHVKAEKLEPSKMVLKSEPGKPGPTYYGRDEPYGHQTKVDVARKILTVFEAFPAELKELTAVEILAQIRKIVGFEA